MTNATCTKSRSILHKSSVTSQLASFGRAEEENPEDNGTVRILVLAREDWEDMGQPETITITIEPGDHLNS